MSKKSKNGSEVTKPEYPSEFAPITLDKDNNIRVQIYAKPGAKQNAVTGITAEGVNVQIHAPPTEGAANTELLKYMALVLGIRSSSISLERGHKSRFKILRIFGNIILDDVKKKINQEIREPK